MRDSPAALRAWIGAHRAAEEREQAAACADVVPPSVAFARFLRLVDLAADLHGWPLPQDPLDVRADLRVYATWMRLRERLGR